MSDPAKNITADSAAILKPARHYTEYNIFFQLEREYILQVLLSVEPTYEPSEIFHPEHTAHYQGPYLPSRYQDIVLPNDWYIPGKARRRKRRHRKSHGAIGFHELSLKIAKAWSNVDDETRTFCACLSDIGMLQYKRDMQKYQRLTNCESSGDMSTKQKATTTKTNKKKKKKKKGFKNSPDITLSSDLIVDAPFSGKISSRQENEETNTPLFGLLNQDGPKHEEPSPNQKVTNFTNSAFDQDMMGLCLSNFTGNYQPTSHQANQVREVTTQETTSSIVSRSSSVASLSHSKDSMVDMADDEIMNIWASTVTAPVEASSENSINQAVVSQYSNNGMLSMRRMSPVIKSCNNNDSSGRHNDVFNDLNAFECMKHMRFMLAEQQYQLQQMKIGKDRNFVTYSA